MKAAKLRGYKFICGVSFIAASMAFSILDACDVRYALDSSKLLFHSAAIGGVQRVNMFDALEIYNMLAKINGPLVERLLTSTGMDKEIFAMAFYQEKLWDALEFKEHCKDGYINIVTDYQGLDGINLY
jgi:ATP-dependent protease ClpP protease subunit